MKKGLWTAVSAAFFFLALSELVLACGCGGGCGSCGGGSCQEGAQVCREHNSTTSAVAPTAAKGAVNIGNKICPVLGEKINEQAKATYEYEGKVYNFCCAGCIDAFKKDPQKYAQKVKEELNKGSQ